MTVLKHSECRLGENEWDAADVSSALPCIATAPLLPNQSGEGTLLVSRPFLGHHQVNLSIVIRGLLFIVKSLYYLYVTLISDVKFYLW